VSIGGERGKENSKKREHTYKFTTGGYFGMHNWAEEKKRDKRIGFWCPALYRQRCDSYCLLLLLSNLSRARQCWPKFTAVNPLSHVVISWAYARKGFVYEYCTVPYPAPTDNPHRFGQLAAISTTSPRVIAKSPTPPLGSKRAPDH